MNFKEKYSKEIIPKLKEKFAYKNIMEVPSIQKIVVNVGFGRHAKEKAYIKNVLDSLAKITGQKAILTKAKKSIASFKVREGANIGARVTLRGSKMYDFIDKLINVTYPRVTDFRGVNNKCIDRTGNMTVGFKENAPFPEIDLDDLENVFGLEISFATTAKTREESLEMFKLIGFPFKKD